MGDIFVGIDAHTVAYRGFYAFKDTPLRNSKGLNTSAVYYFYTLVKDILRQIRPKYMLVAFDSPSPTFRHKILTYYKANRPPQPDELRPQIRIIKELAEAMGIKTYAKEGFEADDILGSVAVKFREKGIRSILVTTDKDVMALVDDYIRVMDISTKDNIILDAEKIEKKFGVKPQQLPDYLLLVGDSADNIPGIKGIGKKTAIELLQKFGSLEEILKNLHKLPQKLVIALKEEGERITKLREVYSLRFDAFDGKLEDLSVGKPQREKLVDILRELEFFSALSDIAEYPKIPEIKPFKGEEFKSVGFDGKFYFSDGENIYTVEEIKPEVIGNKYCINSKEIYKVFPNAGILYDLSIGDYLLLPEIEEMGKDRHNLESLALKYKAWKPVSPLGAFSAYLSAQIGDYIAERLKGENLWDIYVNLDLPLSMVLAYMENNGVMVSIDRLEELGKELNKEIKRLEEEIYNLSGVRFNLNSPKQLAHILFERLKLPPVKKTKTGYSTDVEVLTELSKLHPLPAKILEYRELFKLKSTYIEALVKYVQRDGRIHPTFSQTTTATGRLSCFNPNLQNIPVRGIWGKKLREAFVCPKGYKLVSLDYSQIELRILAHLSGDENLKRIFYEGRDIHLETAKALFGKEEIKDDERRVAKTVNFGIIYGISPYGLSKAIGVDYEIADRMIKAYYERFPGVKRWQEKIIEFARENGYVQTLMGRRRYIFVDPKINDAYRRITINTPVQGSAADMIKKAMIDIYGYIKGKKSKMVLQVHDELLFEIAEEELGIIEDLKNLMENAIKLDVPVVVDVGIGDNWAEAKP
ncbi:MAG: DNA polymerase I [candidate division WOR-3 bacterium]